MSWDGSTAATARPSDLESVVWSPCDRFIAITWRGARLVDVLDSVTLQRLQTLEFPQGISTEHRALIFSPDSRILTCSSGYNIQGHELFVVSWDLQTGGVASIIRWPVPGRNATGTPSVTYSANGKMVGVSHSIDHRSSKYSDIFICDVVSGVLMYSHPLDNTVLPEDHIWIYGESLRFATADATTITIWEVQFTSGTTPTGVETLPAPDGFRGFFEFQLLPDPSQLVFAYLDQGRILVWDARNSRYLLECADAMFYSMMSFSYNGRFFACSTTGPDTYLWKESPDGYILHRILASGGRPLLAGNGESFVTRSRCAIQLWRTRSFTTTPYNILAEGPRYLNDFILEFSPDERLAVVTEKYDNTVTVLNLKSGAPQLTIDASMDIYGLGVIGNTAVVIGYPKVIAWDLPAGEYVSHARVGLECSSWTLNLGDSGPNAMVGASISPDSRYIAFVTQENSLDGARNILHIYNASTGEHLGEEPTIWVDTLRFSPDGRDVWYTGWSGGTQVWRVGGGQKVLECLMYRVDMEHPPEGNPWGSSRGYRVTNDWWILGPDGKRLLMLPPPWQSYAVQRVWKGRFLALLHGGSSKPIILEFEVNHDP